MRNVADKICGESQNTHFIVNDLFFLKSGKKYVTVRQTTDDNTVQRRKNPNCMQDNEGEDTKTLSICKTYLFCVAKMVALRLFKC